MTDNSLPLEQMGRMLQRLQDLWLTSQQQGTQPDLQIPDPKAVQGSFLALWQAWAQQPEPLIRAQLAWWQDATQLWQKQMQQWLGQPATATPVTDKRFKDEAWQSNAVFDFVRQAYLLTADHIQQTVAQTQGLDAHTARKVQFYTRQWVDALSPSNFVTTNPVALKTALESKGETLIKGMEQLIADLQAHPGKLMPQMTDYTAFKPGENVAISPGQVVFENELMQLIQYAPATEQVHQRPLLIIPPWINKFYILDLKPKNSLVKWAVDQGYTVFVISWVNPDASLRHKNFEDYMLEGPLAALDAIEKATGEKKVMAAAYCIGGTLLAATLAYMAAKRDSRIQCASFFTSMTDFSEVGELSVFVDEQQIAEIEAYMAEKGYLEGHQMATVFNMLRENDLIWSFVINNYLLGKEPMPFDLLYWNSDSTRMPAAMHSFYLRNMYLHNRLREPGGITLAGVPIDLRKIKTPAYFISTREDHIAPWASTYAGTQLLSGPVRFVLGGSGHIAGIVNPPSANKYGYSVNAQLPPTPQEWLAGATQQEGSWWLDWDAWLTEHRGKTVAARQPGDRELTPIEPAPGRYVKVRIN